MTGWLFTDMLSADPVIDSDDIDVENRGAQRRDFATKTNQPRRKPKIARYGKPAVPTIPAPAKIKVPKKSTKVKTPSTILVPKARLVRTILPRTLIGILVMLLAVAIGAGLSGGILYSYYDYRLNQNQSRFLDLSRQYDARLKANIGAIDKRGSDILGQVQTLTDPLKSVVNDPQVIATMPAKFAPQIFVITTADTAGHPVIGSAFVVATDPSHSYLLTSYAVVAAAAASPAPTLTLTQGSRHITGTLWSWDPAHDLALIQTNQGNIPPVSWADDGIATHALGLRVFGMAAGGGAGSIAIPGNILDATTSGYVVNIPPSPIAVGGPMITGDGKVLGVLSNSYNPIGVPTGMGALATVPPISAACAQLLHCVAGSVPAPTKTG